MKKIYKIAIIGRTNSGKSTLFNNLLNKKIAAVTKKINTTQIPLKYIFKEKNNEWLLLDSPGLCKAVTILDKILFNNLLSTIQISNIVWWVVDIKEIWKHEMNILLKNLKEKNKKVILIINKIDLVEKDRVMKKFNEWKNEYNFESIVPISAKKKINFENLIEATKNSLKNIEKDYEIISLSSKKDIIKEIIREQILQHTNEEIPYFTTLKIIELFEKNDGIFTNIEIIVDTISRKKIIIGKKAEKIKSIRLNTISILNKIWNKKITIFFNVKVFKDWHKNKNILQELQFKWE